MLQIDWSMREDICLGINRAGLRAVPMRPGTTALKRNESHWRADRFSKPFQMR